MLFPVSMIDGVPGKISFFFFLLSPFAFFELIPFDPLQIWTSKTSNKDISKAITASSIRFGQLKEDVE